MNDMQKNLFWLGFYALTKSTPSIHFRLIRTIDIVSLMKDTEDYFEKNYDMNKKGNEELVKDLIAAVEQSFPEYVKE